MEFFETVKQRKSVREYSEKEVSKALLEKIVDAGRVAATARNEQPWEFIVTKDKETLTKICSMCPNGPFIKDASCLILVFTKETKYYLEDGCAATENMLLAIEDLALGGCWIAGDKKDYGDKISEMLGVPSGYKLVSMITVGYPKKNKAPKEKRPLEEVIHWEKWK